MRPRSAQRNNVLRSMPKTLRPCLKTADVVIITKAKSILMKAVVEGSAPSEANCLTKIPIVPQRTPAIKIYIILLLFALEVPDSKNELHTFTVIFKPVEFDT